MLKLFVFAPKDKTDEIIDAMSKAGAGNIGNYSQCAFITPGEGNWKSEEGSTPTIGEVGKVSREPENKIEMICTEEKLEDVLKAVRSSHPYETPQVDILKLYE